MAMHEHMTLLEDLKRAAWSRTSQKIDPRMSTAR